MSTNLNNPVIPEHLLESIQLRLGLSAPVSLDLKGLNLLYQAWCLNVPFDNVRKMISLFNQDQGKLPGSEAIDFFEYWLQHGTGGTCWPSSNALFSLLITMGFDARRVSGSMLDRGKPNHGSIIVRLEEKEWLVDSSMLTNQIVRLNKDQPHIKDDDPLVRVETDPVAESFLIWFTFPTAPMLMPCRLLEDPVDLHYYQKYYEHSRNASVFNQRLYARKNYSQEIRVLQGNMRLVRRADGIQSEALSATQVKEALIEDIGLTKEIVDRWASSGALDASMRPSDDFKAPPFDIRPPSAREESK